MRHTFFIGTAVPVTDPIVDKRSGLSRLLNHLFVWLPIQSRRKRLSKLVDAKFAGTVAHGPFAGQKLTPGAWWGAKDRASMLLGLYEREVLDVIVARPARHNLFIDIGAADGYYVVGALKCAGFAHAIAYEISAKGQACIADNARSNGVGDRVEIRGKAEPGFWQSLDGQNSAACFFLIDIEGGEIDICDDAFFEAFRRSMMVIELHPMFVDEADRKFAELRARAERWFDVSELRTGARDPAQFEELAMLEDTDRWLIASEGRKRLMHWLVLRPRE
jgi:hypothetical protein